MGYLIRIDTDCDNGITARLTTLGAARIANAWLLKSDQAKALIETDLQQSLPNKITVSEITNAAEFDRLKEMLLGADAPPL
jgi:hypothetical protein